VPIEAPAIRDAGEIAPGVTRAAILWDPALPARLAQFGAIQSVASSVEVSAVDVRDAAEIERASRLLRLDVGCPDDLAPFRRFVRN
jgi:hypothetical protein